MKKDIWIILIVMLILFSALPGSAQENTAAVKIEALPGDGIVVLGDVTFTIASDARFFGRDEQTSIDFSKFAEGDWVEFSVNSEGEIDEMWLSTER